MAKTRIHAIHIFIDNDQLVIEPYKLTIRPEGFGRESVPSAKRFHASLKDKRNAEVIGYLLDADNWQDIRTYWDGYQTRKHTSDLTTPLAPARITKWVESLPEYELTLEG